ncbi:AAA family ATPase [Arsenicibacter rosenii]|uniref:ATPase AAA-type core domain-containing protein n=1 Tax=Arsenicibacter rosenii TaxID=1750698 RepID=A0A1S2VHK2_9BACT|nr:AAA family ATPase [Arsenicibacter rosenii]OIN58209.1 hypothetical protein BLX24_16490 [Arsenicibacter rosenii]
MFGGWKKCDDEVGERIHNFHIPNDLEREFPIAPHFVQRFGQYPNYIYFSDDFRPTVRDLLQSRGFSVINSSLRMTEKGWQTVEQILEHPDGILLKLELMGDRFCRIHGYFQQEDVTRALLSDVYEHKYQHEENQTHIYLIQSGMGGLHTERVEIKPPDIDLELHYNDDFLPVHERLVSLLEQPKSKGLILLHGEPGTGKTTYIKHLSAMVKKDMLILPPYMTNYLTSPEIIPFLLENKDSVLIIEDAERILQAREAGGDTNSVSNILNLTDGLLADCMHIQVIATFNANKSLLDKALLRKGRLMVDYAFGKLTAEKSNRLLNHLGSDFRTNDPMTLAEIFNREDQTVSGDRPESTRVGF